MLMAKLYSDRQDPFVLLAINTAEDDYHLAWLLNEHLSIALSRVEHVEQAIEDFHFSVFYASDATGNPTFTLVRTLSSGKSLLKQLKNVDFILKISGTLTDDAIGSIIATIRTIPQISACILVKQAPSGFLSALSLP